VNLRATIIHPGGRTEARTIGSAAEFQQLLSSLSKKATVALDDGPHRQVRDWRNGRGLWPWRNENGAGAPSSVPAAGTSPVAAAVMDAGADPATHGEAPRIAELAGRVDQLGGGLDELYRQVGPLPARIDELGERIDRRVFEETGRLRGEIGTVREAFASELRPVTTTLAALNDALRARPEKAEIATLVEQAVAPATKRVDVVLGHLREENELLVDEGDELRRRIHTYKPGTIDELRQRIAELQQDVAGRRDELIKAHGEIDRLQRDNAHLKDSTGVVDREELTRLREGIAKERQELESARELAAQRDKLQGELAELRALEDRYRAGQVAKERDLALEERVRTADTRCGQLERELQAERAEVRRAKERTDGLRGTLDCVQRRNRELEKGNADLETAVRVLTDRVTGLDAAVGAHTEEKAELADQRKELATRRIDGEKELAERRRALDDHARELSVARTAEHEARMQRLEDDYGSLRAALDEKVRAEVSAAYERELRQAREARGLADEAKKRAEAASDLARTELAAMRTEHVAWEGRKLERELALQRHQYEVEELTRKRDELASLVAADQERVDTAHTEAQRATEQLVGLAAQVEATTARLADVDRQYKDELRLVEKLHDERRRLEEPKTREARIKSMMNGVSGFGARDRGTRSTSVDEMTWLGKVEDRMLEAEFVFPRSLLEAFHTSLKITQWSPLTVLAGVSGTGKSALPRLYAHFGGLRFHMAPVQPNWDSPQDLFGFFNHIDGLYKATPLLRALVQSQSAPERGGFNDGLLLVGLDEMNLARVEYYGSELLSRWEARRDGADAEALQLDIGHGEHEEIRLGHNVLWAGTMNEDETTQSLSDKVLERGNVITFPRPRTLKTRDGVGLGEPGPWLSVATFGGWTVGPDALHQNVRDHLKDALEAMNRKLALVNRSVSHRILQAIETYVANHPQVRAAQSTNEATERWWRQAFADQIVQKVMPKLRGLDNGVGKAKQCLDGFDEILGVHAEELVGDFREARKEAQFLWTSAEYLERRTKPT